MVQNSYYPISSGYWTTAVRIQLPEGTTILRLDPLGNHPCVVWYLAAEINGIPLRADPFNAQQEGIWYFDNDPANWFYFRTTNRWNIKDCLGCNAIASNNYI